MRASLRIAFLAAVCSAAIIGSPAWAARSETPFTFSCEGGTVSLANPAVLWPPDHKFHPYTVSYDGGRDGDVLAVSAVSSDGGGVQDPGPVVAYVQTGETSASTSVGLFAQKGKPGTNRYYAVWFNVAGSNSCGGAMLVVPPENGRPA